MPEPRWIRTPHAAAALLAAALAPTAARPQGDHDARLAFEVGRPTNDARIIGGSVASLGAYPMAVQLHHVVGRRPDGRRSTELDCGGALIAQTWVLTAAHGVYARRDNGCPAQVVERRAHGVGAGLHALERDGRVVSIRRIILPPGCREAHDPRTVTCADFFDDVALVELDQPIHIPPGTLVSRVTRRELLAPGARRATVLGSGATVYTGQQNPPLADWLLHVQIDLLGPEVCRRAHPGSATDGSMFCADVIDRCPGDGLASLARGMATKQGAIAA